MSNSDAWEVACVYVRVVSNVLETWVGKRDLKIVPLEATPW